ncbi:MULTISPECIES: Crp/Fnr family transcriptional regulator [unclassified Sphingobacterium]|uniref:Crp/Fnr family transcriptional regulator n=1 Tax=unclassified Sphingobacterium TaxID=2609468 RepID=UPI00104FD6B2|nr:MULTISPECIES: Crp/Fnr family transcriptional regulator [unclassified Sphingobacterium]MCS3554090.1 CRP-like cAMP-binding protein [Sphingobacterium sp. JUb21]TCR07924.1 CRP-like cAMP-binding protein [Sphingobacterium sp. JUb20]
MDLKKILVEIYPLPEESISKLMLLIREVHFPKGHIIIKANKIEKSIYFIKKGIVRAYAEHEDLQRTFWFGEEGETILSMKSYAENERSYEFIELMEPCQLYELEIKAVKHLFNEDIYISNWGRKLAEKELIKVENKLISREIQSAKERYELLVSKNPSLLRRIQLKYLASYLGITQVTLSRIRKKS